MTETDYCNWQPSLEWLDKIARLEEQYDGNVGVGGLAVELGLYKAPIQRSTDEPMDRE